MSFETPERRRLAAKMTGQGYSIEATIEGKGFIIELQEAEGDDVANKITTTQAVELASTILNTRAEFVKRGIPLAIPDFPKFIEERKKKMSETKVDEKITKMKKIPPRTIKEIYGKK